MAKEEIKKLVENSKIVIDKDLDNFIKSIHKICEDNQKHIAFLSGNGELDSTNTFDIRNTLSEFYSVEYFDISMYEMDSVSGNLKIQEQIVG